MNFAEKITGEKITLEQTETTFKLAEELIALVDTSREDLLPWLTWALKNKTAEDEFAYLLNWCQKNKDDDVGCAYAIRENTSGRLVGTIDFFRADQKEKSGEIGYWLGSEFVGKGYMHEAVMLLEKEIFNQGFNRIVIRNDIRNMRSANVAKRAGYHLDGVLRQNHWSEYENCFTSSNIWSKLREEFEK